ncbi:MAG: hypothetical protein ACYDBO_02170 [Vulcanimicrobiaceae bacterium]
MNTAEPAYLFLDSETTGTNRYEDQIWQLSWSLETRDHLIADRDFCVHHTSKPSPWVAENTRYNERMADDALTKFSRQLVLRTLMDDIAGAAPSSVHLVCANPTFDDYFLHKMTWGVKGAALNYHYVPMCIENIAMGAYNALHGKFLLKTPPRLNEIPALFGMPQFPPGKSHDARFDRCALRDLFWAIVAACEREEAA